MSDGSKQATPKEVLRAHLLNSSIPKTELEHYAADEIERLEGELVECKEWNAKKGFERDRLEAQSAAMREAIESVVRAYGHMNWQDEVSLAMNGVRSALSPDAGRKVLAVVEAAKEFLDYTDRTSNAATNPDWTEPNKLRQALAAMEETR